MVMLVPMIIKKLLESAGEIAIDSIYTPVTRVSYDVEKTRVGQDASYDKLNIRSLDKRKC